MNKKFKCPLCERKDVDKDDELSHMSSYHGDEIPKDRSVGEFYYNLTKGKMQGNCVICNKPTEIKEKTQELQETDRTLELRLKQLDTEQEALQTELDSVKKVIDKNIDNVFKTFQS